YDFSVIIWAFLIFSISSEVLIILRLFIALSRLDESSHSILFLLNNDLKELNFARLIPKASKYKFLISYCTKYFNKSSESFLKQTTSIKSTFFCAASIYLKSTNKQVLSAVTIIMPSLLKKPQRYPIFLEFVIKSASVLSFNTDLSE